MDRDAASTPVFACRIYQAAHEGILRFLHSAHSSHRWRTPLYQPSPVTIGCSRSMSRAVRSPSVRLSRPITISLTSRMLHHTHRSSTSMRVIAVFSNTFSRMSCALSSRSWRPDSKAPCELTSSCLRWSQTSATCIAVLASPRCT